MMPVKSPRLTDGPISPHYGQRMIPLKATRSKSGIAIPAGCLKLFFLNLESRRCQLSYTTFDVFMLSPGISPGSLNLKSLWTENQAVLKFRLRCYEELFGCVGY